MTKKIRGIMPICHMVLENEITSKDELIKIIEEIVYDQIITNPSMSSRQIPTKFRVWDSMPLTKNNKIDFNALKSEQLNGSEINVEIHETNLTVERIMVY